MKINKKDKNELNELKAELFFTKQKLCSTQKQLIDYELLLNEAIIENIYLKGFKEKVIKILNKIGE